MPVENLVHPQDRRFEGAIRFFSPPRDHTPVARNNSIKNNILAATWRIRT